MKKVFLDIGFDYDFILFGIVSQESSHRLVWLINKQVQLNFSRKDDLKLVFENNDTLNITHFSFTDEINHLQLDLFSNKDENNYWMPELRSIDYFIMVKGAIESFRKRKFTEPFKKIETVQIITEINHQKLKEKERLIF